MDRGLNDFLQEIGTNLRSTIATIAMGGAGPEVKLDDAVENLKVGRIRKHIEEGATSREVEDLIENNLRFLSDPEDPERLKVTKEILNCQDLIGSGKRFNSGGTLLFAISRNSACQFKAIAENLDKNGKTKKGNMDLTLRNEIFKMIDSGNQKMFDTVMETNILEKSWANQIIQETIKKDRPEMFKKAINKSEDITHYQEHRILATAQEKYEESKGPEDLKFVRAILNKYPKNSLKDIAENKNGQWIEEICHASKSILHNTKRAEKEMTPSM
jgi:hypothetical protein